MKKFHISFKLLASLSLLFLLLLTSVRAKAEDTPLASQIVPTEHTLFSNTRIEIID